MRSPSEEEEELKEEGSDLETDEEALDLDRNMRLRLAASFMIPEKKKEEMRRG